MKLGAFEITEPLPKLRNPHAFATLRPWVDVGSVGRLTFRSLERHFQAQDLATLTKPGVFFGDAVVVSIASTTSLSIGSTAGLSGAAIAATTFQVSQQPKFMVEDSKYSERNSDYSSHVYGVSGTLADEAQAGQYATSAGWVGVQTYVDSGGNLRVKKEVLVAMSGITTGNTPHYPKVATAN